MRIKVVAAALVLLFAGGISGYLLAQKNHPASAEATMSSPGSPATQETRERKILYWYDPMSPATHFDKPGKSPFMDMDLVPRYASEEGGARIRIDPVQVQNLAIKTEKVVRGTLAFASDIAANIEFNSHRQAKIQARAEGFVEKSYPLSIGDPISKGTPIAEITIAAFTADQSEYLLLKAQHASEEIIAGLREKMRLAGMPEEMLSALEKSGKVQTRLTVRAPMSGILTGFDVYTGMNISKEMTMATIQGADPIWITANVAESDLHLARTPSRIRVSVQAYPERVFQMLSATLLPGTDTSTRTTPLRLTLNNADGLLRPGMSASIRLRGKGEESLLIPTQSLIDMGEEKRVIVRAKDGAFVPRLVQVLQSSREQTAIAEGIEEGEEVVVSGLFLIDSEANLQGALDRMRKTNNQATAHEQTTTAQEHTDLPKAPAGTTPAHAH